MTLERKWKTQSRNTDYACKRSTDILAGCKSATAANVDLTKSLLNNSLKNIHIIVDKIYYLPSLFVFFLRILVFKFIAQPQKPSTKTTTRQLAKIRLE